MEDGSRRHAAVVEIDARRQIFVAGRQIDPRGDGANGVLEVQIEGIAKFSTLDIVLFRGNPQALAIWRHRRSSEIIRDAPAADFRIGGIGMP